MSELINNSHRRKEILMDLLLRLHQGESPEKLRAELEHTLVGIPYIEVLQVEQEMISLGMPASEVAKLCDAHSSILQGLIDKSGAKEIPPGHPAHVFKQENKAILQVVSQVRSELGQALNDTKNQFEKSIFKLRGFFNQLSDIDKHYKRKEYLIFPFLEAQGITAPPEVMWSKHDEIREQIKGCHEILENRELTNSDLQACVDLVMEPALFAISEMVVKEEEILIPMCMDTLTEENWVQVHQQTLDYGFCIIDPVEKWESASPLKTETSGALADGFVQFASGKLSGKEIELILNTLPLDMTFVDKDDKVKYFTQGAERIFQRNRAILGRNVKHCHPPASAHIVEKILEDFRSGKESRAPFWIQMGERFIHIEYYALRDESGQYLGCLEISQNLTPYRALQGEQRILNYTRETHV